MVKIDNILVFIVWLGVSVEDVVLNILEVIELEFWFIDGLDEIIFYGWEGSVLVWMDFVEGINMQQVLFDVEQVVVGVIMLLLDFEMFVILVLIFIDGVVMFVLCGLFFEQVLKVFVCQMWDDFLVWGIDKVELFGYCLLEYLVEIFEWELCWFGLMILDMFGQIVGNMIDIFVGNLEGVVEWQIWVLFEDRFFEVVGWVEVQVLVFGEMICVEDIGMVVCDFDGNENQGFLKGICVIEIKILWVEGIDMFKVVQVVEEYFVEVMLVLL